MGEHVIEAWHGVIRFRCTRPEMVDVMKPRVAAAIGQALIQCATTQHPLRLVVDEDGKIQEEIVSRERPDSNQPTIA